MNREILFRGKWIKTGEWLYGDFRLYREVVCGIFDRELGHTRRVDKATVGQYTGLTDKNGKKIFEGDVMEFDAYESHYKGEVFFDQGIFASPAIVQLHRRF